MNELHGDVKYYNRIAKEEIRSVIKNMWYCLLSKIYFKWCIIE